MVDRLRPLKLPISPRITVPLLSPSLFRPESSPLSATLEEVKLDEPKDPVVVVIGQPNKPPRVRLLASGILAPGQPVDRSHGHAAMIALKRTRRAHEARSEHLKSIVYGALDGIQSSFALICGVEGGGLPVAVVLMLGFASLLSNGLSMGIGDALSEAAELKYIATERQREAWEYEHYLEGEIQEMVDVFVDKGMSRDDAERASRIMSKYETYFVNLMMTEELNLQVPTGLEEPWKNGLVTFASFLMFGFCPLVVYLLCVVLSADWGTTVLFGGSIGITVFALLVLGALKGRLSGTNPWRASLEVLVAGSMTATASYGIAYAVDAIVGKLPCPT